MPALRFSLLITPATPLDDVVAAIDAAIYAICLRLCLRRRSRHATLVLAPLHAALPC